MAVLRRRVLRRSTGKALRVAGEVLLVIAVVSPFGSMLGLLWLGTEVFDAVQSAAAATNLDFADVMRHGWPLFVVTSWVLWLVMKLCSSGE